jgi:hypothetical protein
VLDATDAPEGSSDPGWFMLWRGGSDLSAPLTVNYTLGGNASLSDYTVSGTPGEATFAAGEAAAYVNISRVPGNPGATGSSVTLTVAAGAGYGVVAETATLYLIDAPAAGTSSVSISGTNTHFNLTNATELALTDSTVKAGTTDVTVTAYKGGTLDAKIDDPVFQKKFPANPSAISLVATSSSELVVNDLKWVQFNMRTATFEAGKNQTYFRSKKLDAKLKEREYYFGRDEWVVDSTTPNSAIYAQATPTVRGASGQDFALGMYDLPAMTKEDHFTSETFKARSYLVYKKEVIYTVEWSITITKTDGVWSDPVVTIDKSGPGKLDFPVDANANDWVWRYKDTALTDPVKVSNPLK